MKIKWFLLAEGLGQDSRGVITAIGLNQNIISTPSLPVRAKRAVVAHLEDDLEEGEPTLGVISVSVTVQSPSGQTISAQTNQVTVGRRPFSKIPGSGDVPIEIMLSINEYGIYKFFLEVVGVDSLLQKAEERLYVIEAI